MADRWILSVVTRKGHIAIPAEICHALSLKSGDRMSIDRDGDGVKVVPAKSRAALSFGAVPPLKARISDREVSDLAWEEHAEHVASVR